MDLDGILWKLLWGPSKTGGLVGHAVLLSEERVRKDHCGCLRSVASPYLVTYVMDKNIHLANYMSNDFTE